MTDHKTLRDICDSAIAGNKMKRVAFISAATPQRVLWLLKEIEALQEICASMLWHVDYPLGGSVYKTYESTQFHDKQLYRKQVSELLSEYKAAQSGDKEKT